MHTTGLDPVHRPDWHVSVCVHALPSLQAEPLGLAGLLHEPVPGLHVPTSWHWSNAVHTTGLVPLHTPDWQLSIWVQALPSLQDVPFGFAGLLHRPLAGLHVPTS